MELSDLPEDMRAHIQDLFFTAIHHSLLLWRQVEGYQCYIDKVLVGRTNEGWVVDGDSNLQVKTTKESRMHVHIVNPNDPEEYAFTVSEKPTDLDASFFMLIHLIRYKKKGAMHRTVMTIGPQQRMEVIQHFQ